MWNTWWSSDDVLEHSGVNIRHKGKFDKHTSQLGARALQNAFPDTVRWQAEGD